jgi:TPR repeat protein
MYKRFLDLWSEPVSDEDRKLRPMTDEEKSEAWACLNASAEAGVPEATYVLQLFYENGRPEFDVAPDYERAEYYARLTEELRGRNDSPCRLTSSCSRP